MAEIKPIERSFESFCDALDDIVDRYKEAGAISYAEAIGALEFVKAKLIAASFEANESETDGAG